MHNNCFFITLIFNVENAIYKKFVHNNKYTLLVGNKAFFDDNRVIFQEKKTSSKIHKTATKAGQQKFIRQKIYVKYTTIFEY